MYYTVPLKTYIGIYYGSCVATQSMLTMNMFLSAHGMIRHTILIKGRCATDGTNDGSTVTLSGRVAEPLTQT